MEITNIKKAVLFWGILSEEAVIYLKEKFHRGFVLVNPELRPYLLGLGWNRDALSAAGLEFLYCTDNMLGHLFYLQKIKELLILYQKKMDDGYLCLSSSLYVYELAKYHNVDVKFAAGTELDLDKFSDSDASTLAGRPMYAESLLGEVEKPRLDLIKEEGDG